ncbi:MAG: NAD-dependent epimerase/dehydratase family protein [Saprospiraceae bacterium]|nr:NAD-dependent epimerase/dehydratase family protein [Saprospiraceae bacterium]
MILLSGSSGFVGKYALSYFQTESEVKTVSLQNTAPSQVDFSGIKTIIHLAGMAHRMEVTDPKSYFTVNHKLTLDFAINAKSQGVSHFVFVSTVKVYGDNKGIDYFAEESKCQPTDPYGESKWRAEQDLLTLVDDHFLVSIIRPPLVYGSNVKGNLQNLISMIRKYPLVPFGGINNQRSMVYVGNLVALITTILNQKRGGIFLAGDAQYHSTTELVDMIIEKSNLLTKTLFCQVFTKRHQIIKARNIS